jgi:hypothetical protein
LTLQKGGGHRPFYQGGLRHANIPVPGRQTCL